MLTKRHVCDHSAVCCPELSRQCDMIHALQVRAAFISEDGHCETKKLAKHNGRAHKLALEPDQPNCFLSSGEDGAVISFDMRSKKSVKLLVCKTSSRQNTAAVSLQPVDFPRHL